ncbi:hypothetical protein [Arthrobacter sp.]|uniref:hypothetical protein n=1 Tax=Arthrobacter sp. TaxID=1667 RepID=UPI003A8DFCB8
MLHLHPHLVDMASVSADPAAVLPPYDVLPVKAERTPASGCRPRPSTPRPRRGASCSTPSPPAMAPAIATELELPLAATIPAGA